MFYIPYDKNVFIFIYKGKFNNKYRSTKKKKNVKYKVPAVFHESKFPNEFFPKVRQLEICFPEHLFFLQLLFPK